MVLVGEGEPKCVQGFTMGQLLGSWVNYLGLGSTRVNSGQLGSTRVNSGQNGSRGSEWVTWVPHRSCALPLNQDDPFHHLTTSRRRCAVQLDGRLGSRDRKSKHRRRQSKRRPSKHRTGAR